MDVFMEIPGVVSCIVTESTARAQSFLKLGILGQESGHMCGKEDNQEADT